MKFRVSTALILKFLVFWDGTMSGSLTRGSKSATFRKNIKSIRQFSANYTHILSLAMYKMTPDIIKYVVFNVNNGFLSAQK